MWLQLLFLSLVHSLGPLLEFSAEEMTGETFESILLHGQVAVIRGASVHWPIAQWSCAQFRAQPEMGQVERVYGETDGSFAGPDADWENDHRPSGNSDLDGPQFAPLYWSVKTPNPASEFVHEQTSPGWNFVRGPNLWWKKNAAEIWFSPPSSGAKSHIDSHIQGTAVTQLVGTRRWRLASVPLNDPPTLMESHGDGTAFTWTPEITVVLRTGDTLIFPPGTIHDTLNLSNTSCAASITHQYGHPLPLVYYRRKMRELLSVGDMHEVWPVIRDLASFGFLTPRLSSSGPFFESNSTIYDENDATDFFSESFGQGIPGPFQKRKMHEYILFHAGNDFVETAVKWLQIEKNLLDSVPEKFRLYRHFRTLVEEHVNDKFFTELWDFQQNKTGENEICRNV